ncbi:MAG: aromatic-ring-hydroxylating dioxygenase subunit beta [Spongiibacteraceae bacterium]
MSINKNSAIDLIYQEGMLLDEKRFDEWLELYTQDAVFWVPAWDDDSNEYTQNPQTEISLIYYANRDGLADRVFRLKTGRSSASTPEFRTSHLSSNFIVQSSSSTELVMTCAWVTHSFREKKSLSYFGNSYYTLTEDNGKLKISYKKTVVKNDYIDQVLDVYQI